MVGVTDGVTELVGVTEDVTDGVFDGVTDGVDEGDCSGDGAGGEHWFPHSDCSKIFGAGVGLSNVIVLGLAHIVMFEPSYTLNPDEVPSHWV